MGYQIVGKQEINGVGERLEEKIKKNEKLGKFERSCSDSSKIMISERL